MTSVPVPVCPLPRAVMFWDGVQNFLESSSIAGLGRIASTRKYARLFWITIVFAGFTGAGIMINISFKQWEENPITTTIESRPITELTFPKVTVCPPRNTYTDLNYDLKMTKNMSLDNDTRNEHLEYALELLYDPLYKSVMRNLSMLEENDRYYNWYHGYRKFNFPVFTTKYNFPNRLEYEIETYATSGNMVTRHFGETFDADKVETGLKYSIIFNQFHYLQNVKMNKNVTLHVNVETITMKKEAKIYNGQKPVIDRVRIANGTTRQTCRSCKYIDLETKKCSKTYNPPGSYEKIFYTDRSLSMKDVSKQSLTLMPGFKMSWYYSGMKVEPYPYYVGYHDTKTFVR